MFKEIKAFSSTLLNDTVFNIEVWRADKYGDAGDDLERAAGLIFSDRWASFDDRH